MSHFGLSKILMPSPLAISNSDVFINLVCKQALPKILYAQPVGISYTVSLFFSLSLFLSLEMGLEIC